MAITNEADLTHIARTTEQWGNTYDRNVIIPEGVLCIEFTSSGKTNIKIGDGHHIFSRLPYVNGTSEIIDCYTKQETDNRIMQILNNECVVRIKGVLDDVNKLPVHAACGDLWFVIRQNPEQGNKFEEYLYSSEHHWELVGGTPVDIDLSKYATKEYVDGKIRDIESKLHTHDNKSILDQITAAFTKEEKDKLKELYNYDDTELRELIEKSLHNHSNKEVLDSITKYDIEKLRNLENYDDTLLKKKITALEKLAHEHSNKSILDKTTASFTTDYERLMPLIRLYIGATGFEDGAAGLVPPAKAGEQNYVLTGSGKWVPNAGGGVYELPIATKTEIGGVIIGDGINVDENGVISVDASATIDLKTGDGLEIVDVVNPEHTKLPNGYGEISYLESLNGQYTIIDYVPNENTRVVCEFSYQESNVGDQCLFGTRTGNTSGSRQFVLWMEWDSSKPYTRFVYGGNNWGGADVPSDGYTLTCEIGQKMVADVSVNGYYLDNTLIHTVTNTGSPSAYKLAIFHLSNSNTTVESNKTAFKGRIYSFKIYENDVLVANLVPAIVMALNIPGFYDVINNKFYQSSTSNSFTYDASSVIIDSAEKQINLLPATTTDIGGVIVGDGLSITEDGVLSTTSESGMQYEAGRAIEITDKIIPGDLTLDIFQDGTNWANGAYTSSTGNGFLPGYGASVHSPVGNVDSMFKVPNSTNRYRVEKRSVDGTQLSCTVSYIDASGYRFAASPVWEDDDTTIHECPDGTVYITIGIRWLDHSSPISVSDIGVVNLVWIGAGESVENVKVINAQIATTETPGVVTVGDGLTVTEEGVISVDAIPLEPATADKLGGVKIGEGLTITEDGTISATTSTVYNAGDGISITKGSHKIPVEYQEIEYIESSGSAIFDTGYLVNPSTVIDMDCIVYESSKADWQFLYGSRSSTYDTTTVFGFVVRNYHKGYVPELWISGEQLGTSSTFPYNERTILKQNMNELTWYPVSTGESVTITGTGSLPTSSTTLAVSGFKDGSTYTFGPKCRIYSLKISDVNGITRDYVPCYRISDGVVGLYDLINDTFRYSATSTAFISGPIVSDSGGSTDDELYINNTGLLDANLKEDAPGVIIVSKSDETKELDVFQYISGLEVYCVEDNI